MKNMDRRTFMQLTGYGMIAMNTPRLVFGKSIDNSNRPPNIVFYLTDDLGYGHLGCYGQKYISTPNIDQFAKEGMKFTQAYSGCAVCAPSRSSLLTGLHTGHAPVRGNSGGIPMRSEFVTFGELLQQTGYTTGIFGKWGLGDINTEGVPNNQGFDEFFGYLHQLHAHFLYPDYLWDNNRKWELPGNQVLNRMEGDANGQRTQYAMDEILNHALYFINENRDRPFLCFISSVLPHEELALPSNREFYNMYKGKFEETEEFNDPRYGQVDVEDPKAVFATIITYMDYQFGKVMSLLKSLKLDENTLVIFASDNGPRMGWEFYDFFESTGPFRGKKGELYEAGIRIPMIARWPGKIRSGVVNDNTVCYFPDILPTFCEIAGTKIPGNIDGISILPALRGNNKQKTHYYLYWE
jgi:arylsulfatase A-like enzyme